MWVCQIASTNMKYFILTLNKNIGKKAEFWIWKLYRYGGLIIIIIIIIIIILITIIYRVGVDEVSKNVEASAECLTVLRLNSAMANHFFAFNSFTRIQVLVWTEESAWVSLYTAFQLRFLVHTFSHPSRDFQNYYLYWIS